MSDLYHQKAMDILWGHIPDKKVSIVLKELTKMEGEMYSVNTKKQVDLFELQEKMSDFCTGYKDEIPYDDLNNLHELWNRIYDKLRRGKNVKNN